MKTLRSLFLIFFLTGYAAFSQSAKPWTWWFWPGSAVTESGIREQLKSFHQSGFGGVSINSIYATRDTVHPPIPFMSDKWISIILPKIRTTG